MWWFSCDFHTKLKCIQQFIKKIHRKKGTEANQREKIKQEYMLQPWNDRFVNLSMVINHNFCDTLNWIWCLVERKKTCVVCEIFKRWCNHQQHIWRRQKKTVQILEINNAQLKTWNTNVRLLKVLSWTPWTNRHDNNLFFLYKN